MILVSQFSNRITAWPDSDWSGISDPRTRRRLQNRVNQRALRKRRKQESKIARRDGSSDGKSREGPGPSTDVEGAQEPRGNEQTSPTSSDQESQDLTAETFLAEVGKIHLLAPLSARTRRILAQFEATARREYTHTHTSPRPDMLLHLIQYNFANALFQNMAVLRLTAEQMHPDEAVSPFNVAGPWQEQQVIETDFESALPPTLRATPIQRLIPHHPWLDLLPSPQMRDNLIAAGDSYDEEQLCLDMKGHGAVSAESTGIIVWRDPWDPDGWEVTEAFARSWGWVLRGCADLFAATNAWRARRGERPLFRGIQ
ncbi:hypothetical protein BJY01DRAFT_233306 [Aspergillus pseudoustus]|uniref:BZIP domain-containing protein n=1 Tax=Aspergillus pseudoustus TaxID=1810923 RepID=A0ABR4KD84_9EURO